MNGAPVLALVVAAVLVLVYGALLSACEAALTRMTRAAAEDLVQDGRRGAERVLDLAERRTQVLGSVAAVRVAVDMLAAVLLTLAVAGLVDRWWAAGLIAVALNVVLLGLVVLPGASAVSAASGVREAAASESGGVRSGVLRTAGAAPSGRVPGMP